ncbi:uncharacterized protein N7529_011831 [Penicillium soppii]|uniref:uncharacterized protein n=1 Tax=Penicillium soppii TaxID=69789 RepID=UPI0025497180|nr:uncharacterized protein N7529_011831 [Penicillium soppii]KAJ5852446.1 hypothetical protein N7529_011831 [Penicillium soppii]
MNIVEHGYNYLYQEIPQSTARLFFPVSSLVSLSLLSLILTYRYIKHRRRTQKYMTTADCKHEKNPWLQSINMETGVPALQDPPPFSACDILRPLSQTSPFPNSGTLAAIAMQRQNEISITTSNNPLTETSMPEAGAIVQKCDKLVQKMHEEGSEGVRTWKRVIVEYR